MSSSVLRRLASTSAYRLPPTIRQLLSHGQGRNESGDSTVTVHGWIKSIRRQKNVSFAVVSDGSTAKGLQVVFTGSDTELLAQLSNGASVQLTGKLVRSPGKEQDKEFLVEGGKMLGACDPELYPMQKKAHSIEFLRDHAHLRARTDPIAAMVRLRDLLGKRISHFFEEQGFYAVNTPIITANDAEGAGETFKIAPLNSSHPSSSPPEGQSPSAPSSEFFSRPAYLTVSHQLHLEALATAFSRVYTLSPCFRAEPSLTGRHLAEFWMLEAEWAFVAGGGGGGASATTGPTSPEQSRAVEVCDLVEALLKDVVGDLVVDRGESGVHRWSQEDLKTLWKAGEERKRQSLEDAFRSDKPWTKMTYTEAVKELESYHQNSNVSSSERFQYEPKWGRPLQSEHEKWISEKLVGGPTFVTDYPAEEKPFYMRMNEDGKTVACFDLLVPYVGELVGGSVREERLDVLEGRMKGLEREGGEDTYGWYKDLRRWGGAPHAGFGMGFERLVSWVGGIENVRECVPMPRWAGRMLL